MFLIKPHNPVILTSHTTKKAVYCSRCNKVSTLPQQPCEHIALFKSTHTVVESIPYTHADVLRLRRKYGRNK